MYLLYSAVLALGLTLGLPWFLYQGIRRRKYFGSLRERLGWLPVSFNLDGEPSIWVHAVSVGEVLAAAGAEWREALAFANACAMLDLLQAVEDQSNSPNSSAP